MGRFIRQYFLKKCQFFYGVFRNDDLRMNYDQSSSFKTFEFPIERGTLFELSNLLKCKILGGIGYGFSCLRKIVTQS
jgi:hypothetical protein